MLFLACKLDGTLNDCRWNFQKLRRRLHQLLVMHGTVAILGKFLEDVAHASLGSDHGVTWNTQPLGERISRLEANTMDVQGEAIGILADSDNGIVAIGLVNTHSSSCSDAMRVQEDHNLSNHFLGGPGLDHPLFAFRTNAVEFGQAFRGLLNDVKDGFPEGMDQFFGKVRT